MLPFYIYYSMFGFQRVGDLTWAAADQRARFFLIGAIQQAAITRYGVNVARAAPWTI